MDDVVLDASVKLVSLKRLINAEQEDWGGDRKREKLANNQKPDAMDEDDPAASNIKQTADGGYTLALKVDRTFFSVLVGTSGRTKRYIQMKTKAELRIPSQYGKSDVVLIKGKQREEVCDALREVRNRIATMRKNLRPTHFLNVALNTGQVLERFLELKKNILEAQLPTIDKELFTPEFTLHVTLGIYALVTDDDRQRAVKELETCRSFLTDVKTPLDIKVKGLDIMNTNPRSTRLVFAKVECPVLQKFADQCLAHFQTTGLCAKDNNHIKTVKLHMTVMNNRYRQKSMSWMTPYNFDASEILKRFGDFDFGSAQCQTVLLCAMKQENDYYKIAGSLKFEVEEEKMKKTLEEPKASGETKTLDESKKSEESHTLEESKTP